MLKPKIIDSFDSLRTENRYIPIIEEYLHFLIHTLIQTNTFKRLIGYKCYYITTLDFS